MPSFNCTTCPYRDEDGKCHGMPPQIVYYHTYKCADRDRKDYSEYMPQPPKEDFKEKTSIKTCFPPVDEKDWCRLHPDMQTIGIPGRAKQSIRRSQ